MSTEKAVQHIQAALSVGVKPSDVEQAFMSPDNRGRDIWTILDPLRKRALKGREIEKRPPTPKVVKCTVCNDSGLTGGGVENGRIAFVPCSCKVNGRKEVPSG